MEGSSDDAGYWSIPDRRRYNIIHLEGIFRVGADCQDRFAEEIDAKPRGSQNRETESFSTAQRGPIVTPNRSG